MSEKDVESLKKKTGFRVQNEMQNLAMPGESREEIKT
jgi:hypothetical protein